MIGFVKFNNHDIVGNLKNKEFDFINKKNNKPYKTIVLCGENGSGKTTFINYFRITKNNEQVKNYYDKYILKDKWIIEEKFLRFTYYENNESKKYRAYYPIFFNKFFKYPLSTIHDDNEFIEDGEWKEFSNFIFIDFSNQKRSNQANFKYSSNSFSLWKSNYNKTQFQENEEFWFWFKKNFDHNTHKIHNLIKITNSILSFLKMKLIIVPTRTIYIQEFSSAMSIDKNVNDRYGCQWFIVKKNGYEFQPNELSTGEWQLIMNVMIVTQKINEFYENNKSNNRQPIIFIDQPEDNLNPKTQIKLVELYQTLRRRWNIQFFIVTHSIYIIKYFILDDESIVYNFNNYETISLSNPKNEVKPLVVYELNNCKNISFDEVSYLLDQIPTPNYYCNLFECLDFLAKEKYKIDRKGIELFVNKVYSQLKQDYQLTNTNFREIRNYFIHRMFEKKNMKIKVNFLKKCIDFFREILSNELK